MATRMVPILYKSSGTGKLVDVQPIIGYRRPKNLQDILVMSDLPEIKWLSGKNRISIPRCNRSACKHCPVLDRTGWIKSHSTGRKYRTQTRISCTSSNLIYLIQCQLCNMQYVGQTRNKILTSTESALFYHQNCTRDSSLETLQKPSM